MKAQKALSRALARVEDETPGRGLQVIRAKGYSATTIDDICLAAGLTKGTFFHHFKSKEELALAAAGHFAAMADGLFALAPYRALHALKPLSRRQAALIFSG